MTSTNEKATRVYSAGQNYVWAHLGTYIRERRTALKISQLDLANRIGFSPQFLGRIELGRAPIPEKAFRKLIRELQLDEKKVTRIFVEGAIDYVHGLFSRGRIR